MKMRIAPIHARRVTAVDIWRIGLLGQNLFGCFFVKVRKFLTGYRRNYERKWASDEQTRQHNHARYFS
jgi:hypothetical protein